MKPLVPAEPASEAPLVPCPECGGRLVVLSGDGVRETVCNSCGFVMRQHPSRSVPHESIDVVPMGSVGGEPAILVVRARPERSLVTRAWIVGWLIAAYSMYTTVRGHDWFLPVYLAIKYLELFAGVLLVQRYLDANRHGRPLPEGVAAFFVLFLSSLGFAWALDRVAPTIGEPDYCYAATWRPGVPPHVFRCVSAPFAFFGFVVGIWVIGWLMTRLGERFRN